MRVNSPACQKLYFTMCLYQLNYRDFLIAYLIKELFFSKIIKTDRRVQSYIT